jgi:hypothetical protein
LTTVAFAVDFPCSDQTRRVSRFSRISLVRLPRLLWSPQTAT